MQMLYWQKHLIHDLLGQIFLNFNVVFKCPQITIHHLGGNHEVFLILKWSNALSNIRMIKFFHEFLLLISCFHLHLWYFAFSKIFRSTLVLFSLSKALFTSAWAPCPMTLFSLNRLVNASLPVMWDVSFCELHLYKVNEPYLYNYREMRLISFIFESQCKPHAFLFYPFWSPFFHLFWMFCFSLPDKFLIINAPF